uniref:Uncharacterized protein n=1 Tax=Arundo donax TaxID=35708 RepID=A0A0A9CFD5_ARUDO
MCVPYKMGRREYQLFYYQNSLKRK